MVGALLALPVVGAFLWGALGGTHQSYRLESDDEVNRMPPRVACLGCGNEAKADQGMLPQGWWFTKTSEGSPKAVRTCELAMLERQTPRGLSRPAPTLCGECPCGTLSSFGGVYGERHRQVPAC